MLVSEGREGGWKMDRTLRSIELLRADHRDVLARLDALQRAVDARHGPEAVQPVLEDAAAFFRTAIWALVWKEEDALFPAVKPFLPPKGDAIAEMRRDHAELRGANERFQRAASAYLSGSGIGGTMDAVRESGAQIVALLRDHISAENRTLFAVADAHLGDSQDLQIVDTFKTIEGDLAWGFETLQAFYP
jgi:hemerythrin-like domain-containing protein